MVKRQLICCHGVLLSISAFFLSWSDLNNYVRTLRLHFKKNLVCKALINIQPYRSAFFFKQSLNNTIVLWVKFTYYLHIKENRFTYLISLCHLCKNQEKFVNCFRESLMVAAVNNKYDTLKTLEVMTNQWPLCQQKNLES